MRILSILAVIFFIGCSPSDPIVISLCIPKHTIPEGIVVHPISNDIYVSSVHLDRLVQLDESGNFKKIIFDRNQDGYSKGVGMEIYNDKLYALATHDRDSFSLLYIQTIENNKKQTYRVENTSTYFNDLAIDRKGNAFITDTDHHLIYFYDDRAKNVKTFLANEEIKYPNGIAISSDESKLFIDSYTHGIRIVDIKTKAILNTLHSPTAEWGVDGIKYHKGKLYFIVNGIKDKSQHGLYSLDLIDNETEFGNLDPVMVFHEKMKIPTTLSIVDNYIYVLANSQMDLLDQNINSIIDSTKLTDTYVLKKRIEPN